ncbi:MAG: choice-of-anchor Q domain-containing protein [Verrucomicrobiales bacterium]
MHDIDIARWGLGVAQHPNRIIAQGSKLFIDDDQEWPDTSYTAFVIRHRRRHEKTTRLGAAQLESLLARGPREWLRLVWSGMDGRRRGREDDEGAQARIPRALGEACVMLKSCAEPRTSGFTSSAATVTPGDGTGRENMKPDPTQREPRIEIVCGAVPGGRKRFLGIRPIEHCILAALLFFSQPETSFGSTDWQNALLGGWFIGGNWTDGVPNSNTYAVLANGGTALINSSGFPASAAYVDLGVGAGSGTLLISGASGKLQVRYALYVGKGNPGTGALTFVGGTIQASASNTFSNTFSNSFSLGAGGVSVQTNGSELTLSGNISGAGGLTQFSPASTLELTGSNTYTGATAVSAGTLLVNGSITSATNVNSGGTVLAKNTIIALNTSASGPDVNGPLTSEGFNLIGSASGATITPGPFPDQIGVTPAALNLGPMQDNGGSTWTRALLFGSAAIDQGNSSGSFTDQRGYSRPVDSPGGNIHGGGDVGAFEYGGLVFQPEAGLVPPEGGKVTLNFVGAPFTVYSVKSASDLSGAWSTIGTVTTDSVGVAAFQHTQFDLPPPDLSRSFYRLEY